MLLLHKKDFVIARTTPFDCSFADIVKTNLTKRAYKSTQNQLISFSKIKYISNFTMKSVCLLRLPATGNSYISTSLLYRIQSQLYVCVRSFCQSLEWKSNAIAWWKRKRNADKLEQRKLFTMKLQKMIIIKLNVYANPFFLSLTLSFSLSFFSLLV